MQNTNFVASLSFLKMTKLCLKLFRNAKLDEHPSWRVIWTKLQTGSFLLIFIFQKKKFSFHYFVFERFPRSTDVKKLYFFAICHSTICTINSLNFTFFVNTWVRTTRFRGAQTAFFIAHFSGLSLLKKEVACAGDKLCLYAQPN